MHDDKALYYDSTILLYRMLSDGVNFTEKSYTTSNDFVVDELEQYKPKENKDGS